MTMNNIKTSKINVRSLLQTYIGFINYYEAFQGAVTWQVAEDYCVNNLGTHLASIHSSTDQANALSIVNNNDAWIGLNDLNSEGTYEWTDGTAFDYSSMLKTIFVFLYN